MSQSQEQTALYTKQELDAMEKKEQKKPQSEQNTNDWVIYCSKRGRKSTHQQYMKNVQVVGTFNTLSGFFGYYSSLKKPSQLQVDVKIQIFLNGCQPLWEKWIHSGEQIFNVKTYKDKEKQKISNHILDTIWEYLVFSLVGNCLPQNKNEQEKGKEDIIGLILCKRQKGNLIQIWYRSAENALNLSKIIQADIMKELSLTIGKQKFFPLQIRYKLHKDSMNTSSTMKGSLNIKKTV